jgi:hypothetical protein
MDTLFETSDDDLLISVFARQGRTLDDLPYTEAFEAIYEAMTAGEPGGVDRATLFHRLHNIRKAGRLPRMGRAASKPPKLAPEHEAILVELVEAAVGQLSKRDQLLYTPAFDRIVTTFNARAGLSLSPHDVWRVVAKLAK